MSKAKTKPAPPMPVREPEEDREPSPEDTYQVSVSRKELDTLFNAVRALELMREFEDADGERPLIVCAVLLELTSMPAWEVVSDLQGRFRDQELRAAGQLESLEAAVSNISATKKGSEA